MEGVIMRCRKLSFTSIFSFYQKASSVSANNNLLKRFLYQLRINFLPTILMLISISIIALYFSELIERAKLRSNDFKPVQASQTRPMSSDAYTFAKK
jgi:hypothetical protein